MRSPQLQPVQPTREEKIQLCLDAFSAMGSTKKQLRKEKQRLYSDLCYYEEWCDKMDQWFAGWRNELRRLRESRVAYDEACTPE